MNPSLQQLLNALDRFASSPAGTVTMIVVLWLSGVTLGLVVGLILGVNH